MQDAGVQVVDVQPLLGRPQTQLVGRADHLAADHAAAGHPHREAERVVVAAVALLAHRRAAELAAPHHERLVEQAAGLEVGEQRGDGPVDRAAEPGVVGLDALMGIPLGAGPAVELHESDAAFDQPPPEQAQPPVRGGRLLVQAVQPVRRLRLLREVDRVRRLGLHLEGQLVAGDAGLQLGLLRMPGREVAVEPIEQIELALLAAAADLIGRSQMRDRLLALGQPRALVHRRNEAGRPVPRAVHYGRRVVLHDDIRRQVLVLAAEPVADPRPERGPPAQRRAGVHLAHAGGVVQAVAPAGADDGEVIDAAGGVRQPVRDPEPGLAVPGPLALRLQQRGAGLAHRRQHGAEALGKRLPG